MDSLLSHTLFDLFPVHTNPLLGKRTLGPHLFFLKGRLLTIGTNESVGLVFDSLVREEDGQMECVLTNQ